MIGRAGCTGAGAARLAKLSVTAPGDRLLAARGAGAGGTGRTTNPATSAWAAAETAIASGKPRFAARACAGPPSAAGVKTCLSSPAMAPSLQQAARVLNAPKWHAIPRRQ